MIFEWRTMFINYNERPPKSPSKGDLLHLRCYNLELTIFAILLQLLLIGGFRRSYKINLNNDYSNFKQYLRL